MSTSSMAPQSSSTTTSNTQQICQDGFILKDGKCVPKIPSATSMQTGNGATTDSKSSGTGHVSNCHLVLKVNSCSLRV